jgi:hypothetical protein
VVSEVELGGEKSFIGAWYLPDLKVCDELIEYFRQSPEKLEGQIGHDHKVNKEIKDSLDLYVEPHELSHPVLRKYLINLAALTEKYMEKYTAARDVQRWGITENINIQYYRPGGGYKRWHCERIGKAPPGVNRHLVFMTYLNDVFDEGGTEFFYQKVKTAPRKGLTLIWPADWTHLHRGIVSPTEEKYIITGWFDFL